MTSHYINPAALGRDSLNHSVEENLANNGYLSLLAGPGVDLADAIKANKITVAAVCYSCEIFTAS